MVYSQSHPGPSHLLHFLNGDPFVGFWVVLLSCAEAAVRVAASDHVHTSWRETDLPHKKRKDDESACAHVCRVCVCVSVSVCLCVCVCVCVCVCACVKKSG